MQLCCFSRMSKPSDGPLRKGETDHQPAVTRNIDALNLGEMLHSLTASTTLIHAVHISYITPDS